MAGFPFKKLSLGLGTIVRIILLVSLLVMGFDSVAIVILDTVLNVITACIFAVYVFAGLQVRVLVSRDELFHDAGNYALFILYLSGHAD